MAAVPRRGRPLDPELIGERERLALLRMLLFVLLLLCWFVRFWEGLTRVLEARGECRAVFEALTEASRFE